MAGEPCLNHPQETTLLRCGRCDRPFCYRCLVDSPVGKKCRSCASNQTHLSKSEPRQVLIGLLVGLLVALPAGWICQQISLWLLAVPFGAAVAEGVLRGGRRSRSIAMQVVAGLCATAGGALGAALAPSRVALFLGQSQYGFRLEQIWDPGHLAVTVIAVLVAVSRVRFL